VVAALQSEEGDDVKLPDLEERLAKFDDALAAEPVPLSERELADQAFLQSLGVA